jgi:hypothetical protein
VHEQQGGTRDERESEGVAAQTSKSEGEPAGEPSSAQQQQVTEDGWVYLDDTEARSRCRRC